MADDYKCDVAMAFRGTVILNQDTKMRYTGDDKSLPGIITVLDWISLSPTVKECYRPIELFDAIKQCDWFSGEVLEVFTCDGGG